MSEQLPIIYLARHGETAWSLSGQHTGLTDLPLTERGERNARRLGERLKGLTFAKVFTSPLQRARRTCELAGLRSRGRSRSLTWSNGTTANMKVAAPPRSLQERPDWQLFRDGCPGGESPDQVGARADRVVEPRARSAGGRAAFFERAFPAGAGGPLARARTGGSGRYFMLSTASLSALGYEHDSLEPVIRLWNETHHVET